MITIMKQQNVDCFSGAAAFVVEFRLLRLLLLDGCSGRDGDKNQFEPMPNYGFQNHLLKWFSPKQNHEYVSQKVGANAGVY